jgi:hypothetical protein
MAEPTPKLSKPFIVIAGIGLLVIVAFLAVKVLGGGGGSSSSDTAASTAATAATGAPTASTTTTTAPGEPSTPNQSFDIFTTKNPFQPLVTDSATSDFSGGATTASTSPPVDTSGGAVTTPSTIPADQAPAAGTPVSLVEIVDSGGTVTARVIVGSTSYTVKVGDTFATSYRVVSLNPGPDPVCKDQQPSGVFQYGDTTFPLCVGSQVLK